jgi:hypothetical protein
LIYEEVNCCNRMKHQNCMQLDALIIELSKQTYPEVKTLLSAYGYKLYNIGKSGELLSINDELIQGAINIVAVAPE